MGERPVGVPDAAAGAGVAEVRTRERTVGGNVVSEQYVIPISERVASFKGMCTTFRTPGRASTTQDLFSISNAAGSSVLVAVRRLSIQQDPAAVLNTSWANQFKTGRLTAVPSTGSTLTKVALDTAGATDASVVCRGDASADGTASGSQLALTLAASGWHQFATRLHTAAGQVLIEDESLIPALCAEEPIILRAGEALGVELLANATAANGTTVMYLVNCMWEEFTLP